MVAFLDCPNARQLNEDIVTIFVIVRFLELSSLIAGKSVKKTVSKKPSNRDVANGQFHKWEKIRLKFN